MDYVHNFTTPSVSEHSSASSKGSANNESEIWDLKFPVLWVIIGSLAVAGVGVMVYKQCKHRRDGYQPLQDSLTV